MCIGCWEKYGAPKLDTPRVREAAKLIAGVYDYSCVGGNLHIAIDDWNLEDSNLAFCRNEAIPWNVHGHEPEVIDVERRCLDALSALTVPERASALALHDGFWGEPEQRA